MIRTLSILAILFYTTLYSKETVVLKSAETLNGELIHFNSKDSLLIKHIGNSKGLRIKPDQVHSIEFNPPENGTPLLQSAPPKAAITLINGDSLKGEVLSIDKNNVSFNSQSINSQLNIPRNQIHKIIYRSSVPHTIYSQQYSSKLLEHSTNWKLEKNAFSTNTRAEMAQELPLTKNFVIKFTYLWTHSPSLQVFYGASSSKLGINAYYKLDLSNYKIFISQNNSNGANSFFLTKAPNCPKNINDFPNKKVQIEIWVSRSSGNTYLYLDGKIAQKVYFPLTPLGNYIGLKCNESGRLNKHTIQNLKVATWDGVSPPSSVVTFKSEKEVSTFINGDSFEGTLIAANKSNNEMMYQFKYNHAKDSIIEKKESSLSTIYFNKLSPKAKQLSQLPVLLKNEDHLSLTNLTYESSMLSAKHALLGSLKITKKAISKITLTP